MLCDLILAYYGEVIVDHIRRYGNNTIVPSNDIAFEPIPPANEGQNNTKSHQPNTSHDSESNMAVSSSNNQVATRRYPVCNRRPVDRFTY